jgi:hypothetical protein
VGPIDLIDAKPISLGISEIGIPSILPLLGLRETHGSSKLLDFWFGLGTDTSAMTSR